MYFKTKQVILDMTFYKRLIMPVGLLLLLNLASCTKDGDDGTQPKTTSPVYTAKINGKSWTGSQNLSLLVKNSQGTPSKEMRVSASSEDGKLLTLTLYDGSTGVSGDGIAVKTYKLSQATTDAAFVYVDTQSGATYEGAYGTVTITKSDAANKKLTGNFECTVYQGKNDSLKITSGVITDLTYDITEQ
jgi:hypothetical protein